MAGIARDKKREKERAEVELTTPYGAEITVGAKRADALLARPPIAFGDGVWRRYALAGEENTVDVEAERSAAKPPRQGTKANTTADAEGGDK